MATSQLVFFVNGKKIVETTPDPEMTLLQYIRNKLRLTGSKLGCGEGGCGACTVMVSRYNPKTDSITHYSVNACLTPVCSVHGLAVTTVEGIGSTKTRLHPVQERLAKAHGSQCGFCTPGIVMSMYTLLRNNPHPTKKDIEDSFDGNLCRCTGYRPILQGFNTFADAPCGMGSNCCRSKERKENHANGLTNGTANEARNAANGCTENGLSIELAGFSDDHLTNGDLPYDPSQEPIFPPELKTKCKLYETSLKFSSDRVTWHRPVTLADLLELKANCPQAKLLIGNTEVDVKKYRDGIISTAYIIWIETKFKNMNYSKLIAATNIPELHSIEKTGQGLTFGSSVTLSTLNDVLLQTIQELPEHKTRIYQAIVQMLTLFAGNQIRNVASIGGNIMTASPISDLNPLLMAAGASVTVVSKQNGQRKIAMDKNFFQGYRKTVVKADEILLNISIPYSRQSEYFCGFKQAHRKEDDISIVNAGMRVRFKDSTDVVEDLCLAYGGMAPTTVMATRTMEHLKQRQWNDDLLSEACELIKSDLLLDPGTPGGMEAYRGTLTISFFFKFFLHVNQGLGKADHSHNNDAVGDIERGSSEGVQVFQGVECEQDPADAVGRPIAHASAFQQTTGEAIYVDDLPKIDGELFAAFVMSARAHANIVSIDATEALSIPGAVDFVNYKDVPHENIFGMGNDQEIFATKKVVYQGQIMGLIVAETKEIAQRAAKKVHIVYEDLKPILTIEEAMASGSVLGTRDFENGDIEQGFRESDHVTEGELHIGPQEHFYLETVVALAKPTNEDGGMEIISCSQHPSDVQHLVARTLGVQANKITSRVKRIGGGFGGKETNGNLVALPVVVAAAKLNRPVRCMLDRDEDMSITGGRHAFLAKYKVGYTKDGLIKSLDLRLFANCGSSMDLSDYVLYRTLYCAGNAYKIPNIRIKSTMYKTNIASATAFRGFGSPQSMVVAETWMDTIAHVTGKSREEVRKLNLCHENDLTYYEMSLKGTHLHRLWNDCLAQSDFYRRKNTVEQYNRTHRWKKKGISINPVMYSVAFPSIDAFLNQACALVTVYNDGSVLLAHCGIEMGQGLHTKMIQVASRALGIPHSQIYINDTCTDKIHMTTATAASMSSDLNGGAVQNACEILKERLQPFKKLNPKGSFRDWVQAAYHARTHLSAAGYYSLNTLNKDSTAAKGNIYNYFTCSVGCSEVEIDCLTGDHQVLRTDIVMDVGKSLNPAIDIGQVEGAFMQGYGLFLLEQHKTSPSGCVLTKGPGTYKIPAFKNIPVKMNVTLLKDSENPRAVYSSKAVGEPPLFLASTVLFAVKDAIRSAREDAGHSREFRLDTPATPERIRMACADQFTGKFPEAEPGSYTPWYVRI